MRAILSDLATQRAARDAPTRTRAPGSRQSLPDRRNHASREQLLQRVRAEFDGLRGLKLTLPQAQRLFGLREDVCRRVLNTLVRQGLLQTGAGDLYARREALQNLNGSRLF